MEFEYNNIQPSKITTTTFLKSSSEPTQMTSSSTQPQQLQQQQQQQSQPVVTTALPTQIVRYPLPLQVIPQQPMNQQFYSGIDPGIILHSEPKIPKSVSPNRTSHLIPRENVFLIPSFIRSPASSSTGVFSSEDAMPFSCYRQVRDKYYNEEMFKGLQFKIRYHQFTGVDHVLKCPDSSKNQERIFVRGDTVNVFFPPGVTNLNALDNCDDNVWFVVAKAKRNFANKLWRRSFKSIRAALDVRSVRVMEEFIPIVEYGRVNREPKVKSRPSEILSSIGTDLSSSSLLLSSSSSSLSLSQQQQQQQQLKKYQTAVSSSSAKNFNSNSGNFPPEFQDEKVSPENPANEVDEKLARLVRTSAIIARLAALKSADPSPLSCCGDIENDKISITTKEGENENIAVFEQKNIIDEQKKFVKKEKVEEEFVQIRPPISTSPSLQALITASTSMPKEEVKKDNNNNDGVTTIYSPLLKPEAPLLKPEAPLPTTTTTTSSSSSSTLPLFSNAINTVNTNFNNINNFNSINTNNDINTSTQKYTNELPAPSAAAPAFGDMYKLNANDNTLINNSTNSMGYEVECFQINPVQGKSLWIECGLYPIYKDDTLVFPEVTSLLTSSVTTKKSDDNKLFDSLLSVSQECLNSPSFKNPPK